MAGIYDRLVNGSGKLAVVGLGYVGMPLAVAFSNKVYTIGFDTNREKIQRYLNGEDPTNEVGGDRIKESNVEFTWDESKLNEADFIIVSVPTPVNKDKIPDLTLIEKASEMIGKNLKKGSVVVYESTVFPMVTEEVCIPILEKESGMRCGKDFKAGYSPERINPGDRVHRLENIVKIVSGTDEDARDEIAKVYELIIEAGVYKTDSIKVAEAAKVVENAQRDINIAFMNELAIILNKMDISTKEVIDAMGTKWNALEFTPGLVGGHCIGVDPYYFIYQAERLGYDSQIILSGRKINDDMGNYVADMAVKNMIKAKISMHKANVYIFGITFKENCPDSRNSKVVDIVNRLKEFDVEAKIVDPVADKEDIRHNYGLELIDISQVQNADCIIFTVPHNEFKDISLDEIKGLYRKEENNSKVLMDVRSMFNRADMEEDFCYWAL